MTSPELGLRRRRKAANRGSGRGDASISSTLPDAGPDMRMTATPARPGALESANMVATSIIVSESPVWVRQPAPIKTERAGGCHERKQAEPGNEPLPAPAQGQPCALVGLGPRSPRRGQADQ